MNVNQTERLCIRQITNDDVHNLSKVLADPVITKYSIVGVHSERQIIDYIANCQKQYALNGYGHWAIYNSINGEFIYYTSWLMTMMLFLQGWIQTYFTYLVSLFLFLLVKIMLSKVRFGSIRE